MVRRRAKRDREEELMKEEIQKEESIREAGRETRKIGGSVDSWRERG